MTKMLRLLIVALMFMISLSSAFAQGEVVCESDVIVQRYDSLWKIAQNAYGSGSAYPKIFEATNAKAAMDSSYATINNPNFIQVGWKLCIPALDGDTTSSVPSGEAESSSDTSTSSEQASTNVTKITFLQVNDVYEMTPVSGEGGVARLATLRKQLLAANPNTYTVLSGDLFSPSALGTAKVDGERLAGKQMVAAMNAFGLDYATLGNHEFDVKEEEFHQRLAESETTWFSANLFDANGEPFSEISKNVIFTVTDDANRQVRVGLFGLTLDSNPVDYVTYTAPFEAAKEQVEALKDQVDILVAVTHLAMPQDKQLAQTFPEIDLIMGGHEHENAIAREGVNSIPITKADANARTAYILDVQYNHDTGEVKVEPRLQRITSDIPDDPEVAQVVDLWLDRAFEGFREEGFEPTNRVTTLTESLDGTEASVRNKPTKLTELINESMLISAPDTELSLYNGGLIRIDDTIPPGPITEYDVIRILPFGGTIMSVEMTGSLLKQTLDQGEANKGIGGYLQTANVVNDNGTWMVNGEALNPEGSYQVAINDFLLTGKEQNLEFLNEENPDLSVKEAHDDVRNALIAQLQRTYGAE
jgi:5'-nucleotidase